jgi:hypothetical protein
MKQASPELLALFATNKPFEQADIYTFTLTSGYVLRYSTCGFDVRIGINTWLCSRSPGGIAIDDQQDTSGPRARWAIGLDVGTWSVGIMPRQGDMIGDNNMLWAVRAGILDEATVTVDRAYFYAWPDVPVLAITPIGTINVFTGRVAEVDLGRSSISVQMNDPRELLDIDMPRNLYGSGCRFALFDQGCQLNKDNYQFNTTITSVDENVMTIANHVAPPGWFSLGNIVFLTGKNIRMRQMIRAWEPTTGTIVLMAPMPFTVAIGEFVALYPGCDKALATCRDKFFNMANFGGFPFIPAAETAV